MLESGYIASFFFPFGQLVLSQHFYPYMQRIFLGDLSSSPCLESTLVQVRVAKVYETGLLVMDETGICFLLNARDPRGTLPEDLQSLCHFTIVFNEPPTIVAAGLPMPVIRCADVDYYQFENPPEMPSIEDHVEQRCELIDGALARNTRPVCVHGVVIDATFRKSSSGANCTTLLIAGPSNQFTGERQAILVRFFGLCILPASVLGVHVVACNVIVRKDDRLRDSVFSVIGNAPQAFIILLERASTIAALSAIAYTRCDLKPAQLCESVMAASTLQIGSLVTLREFRVLTSTTKSVNVKGVPKTIVCIEAVSTKVPESVAIDVTFWGDDDAPIAPSTNCRFSLSHARVNVYQGKVTLQTSAASHLQLHDEPSTGSTRLPRAAVPSTVDTVKNPSRVPVFVSTLTPLGKRPRMDPRPTCSNSSTTTPTSTPDRRSMKGSVPSTPDTTRAVSPPARQPLPASTNTQGNPKTISLAPLTGSQSPVRVTSATSTVAISVGSDDFDPTLFPTADDQLLTKPSADAGALFQSPYEEVRSTAEDGSMK